MTAQAFADLLHARRTGRGKWQARCPAHKDRNPSLSINDGKDGRVLLKCHAGCPTEAILVGMGLRMSDLYPESSAKKERKPETRSYDYQDANGNLLYRVTRFPEKQFRQSRPDGNGGWVWNLDGVTRVPYHLPELLEADLVLIAEGEKDADELAGLHLEKNPVFEGRKVVTTTNSGGAGKWEPTYSELLKGKDVLVFEDNDEPGRKHAQTVLASVHRYAKTTKLIRLPGLSEHGDVSDWMWNHKPDDLISEIQRAPLWTPVSATSPEAPAPGAAIGHRSGFKLVKLGDLLSQPEVPPDYLLEGMLVRGTVSAVVAKPKVGKSTLARALCLAVATGKEFLGRNSQQGACIYLALEERKEEITADFRAMGADGTEPIEIHANTAPAGAISSLVDLVRNQQPALVIIDPLFRLAHVRDEKAYAEVCAALSPLIDVARETNTHILVTHHSGKAQKGDAIDSPLGSTAISAAVSSLVFLKRAESYRSIQTVQRTGSDLPETVLTFDPQTRLLSIGNTRADADRDAIEREMLEYLKAAGEKSEPGIVDHVEGANGVKRKALRSLVERRLVERTGTGKKGDPFKYSFACTEPVSSTSVQESEKCPQSCMNTGEKLVRGNSEADARRKLVLNLFDGACGGLLQ